MTVCFASFNVENLFARREAVAIASPLLGASRPNSVSSLGNGAEHAPLNVRLADWREAVIGNVSSD